MSDEYICRKCGHDIDDIAVAMINGCQCGARVFKQKKVECVTHQSQVETIEQQADENISILVKEKGVYSVNIKSLMEREAHIDPIIVQDSQGKINVILNPDA